MKNINGHNAFSVEWTKIRKLTSKLDTHKEQSNAKFKKQNRIFIMFIIDYGVVQTRFVGSNFSVEAICVQ